MSDFQDPMDAWAAMGGFPGGLLEPVQETVADPDVPLHSELLLQPDEPAAGASYALLQEQLESPLVVETPPAPLTEDGDLGALDTVVLCGADGGERSVVPLPDAGLDGGQEGLLGLGPHYELELSQPSFSLGEIAEGLQVHYSPPPVMQVASSEDEKPPSPANAALDEGWFAGLKHSNRFRPGSGPPNFESYGRHGRAYDQVGASARARPATRSRSVNPFRRASAQRCRRCGGKLLLGRCGRCATDYCPSCGEALEDDRCTNQSCREATDRCSGCGQEPCGCGGG